MFCPALLPSAGKYGKLPDRLALVKSVMLFSCVPFSVAMSVGVKIDGEVCEKIAVIVELPSTTVPTEGVFDDP
jgi:hypothetical protein